jgi:chaperonin GroEL (HSP60 family)
VIAWAYAMLSIAQTLAENAGTPAAQTAEAVLALHTHALRSRPDLCSVAAAAVTAVSSARWGVRDPAARVAVGVLPAAGGFGAGVDLHGDVCDLGERGGWEPLGVAASCIGAATDTACLITRVDEVLMLPAHTQAPQ